MFEFLSKSFSSIFSSLTGYGKLTEKNIDESIQKIKDSLLESDVPYELSHEFIADIKKEVIGQKIVSSLRPGEQFVKVVYDKLLAFLGGEYLQESFTFQIPSTIMMIGLQGSGKTTSIGKLAVFISNQAKKRGKTRKILCASVDFYRPAAIDQLEILAQQAGIDFYRAVATDPIKASQEIVNYSKQHGYEILLFDTAGRLHVDEQMMTELDEIQKVIKPKYKFLVVDAMIGQESLSVAQSFQDRIKFDYAILSKMDSDARAGVAFSFRYALKKPVLFMGTGEKIDNLEIFRPERIAKRMLGMGDILTLVENAEEKIEKDEKYSLESSFRSGHMTLEDFSKQLSMANRLGSISSMIKYLPGMANLNISSAQIEQSEKEMKKFRAIIGSMTKKEKLYPKILDNSRKQRVAKGAGVSIADVAQLLQRFEQSQQFVKLLKKKKYFN
ncbi:signal recognition particle protein [Candidatus Chromulinivorax destructor]|uniref:signal-recognition-particle GTPase n=1 Tax=Candidatus Chromulinivorax destructor TaxID=2066483 RepID=A0A345ZB21_9BACT|nr:signal recognition particle protein [Candidatus Chromulinivorax destructor]AXK60488.1 signal recognition particle protein [Candidatus Chromulinivorax destructor]